MIQDEQQISPLPTAKTPGFLREHGQKLAALAFWLVVVGGYYLYARANDLTANTAVSQLVTFMTGSLYGPLIYVAVYALRPLLFFPATIITLLGGFLFGPIGILYTVVAANTSAMVAYLVGYFFGQGILEGSDDDNFIQRYAQQMRQNSFETVLIMRLIFLPYDLVNYAAGFLRIRWLPFLLATAIGSIPGTVSIVLLGTSFGTVDELLQGKIEFNPISLAISVALILVSIAISRAVKQRGGVASDA